MPSLKKCQGTKMHHPSGWRDTVSLQSRNYENDLQAAQGENFLPDESDPLITGSVCTDINGERTHPNVRMIDALLGLITSNTSQENETAGDVPEEPQHRQRDEPMIFYAICGQVILMSSWEDSHYFTDTFLTLFPTSESVVTRSRGLSLCHLRLLWSIL